MRALDRKLVRDLWRLKGQALAIALVIGGGVATLVMALSTLHSLEETRRAYYERYRFADVFAHAKRAPNWLMDEIAAIPGVARAEGRIVQDVILDMDGMPEPGRGRVISRDVDAPVHLNDVVIREGRDLVPDRPNEALVHEAFAEAHGLRPGDTFRANVNGHRRALRVVGIALSPEYVYAIGPGEIVPDPRRFAVIWMSRAALEAAYDLKGAFDDVTVLLSRDGSEPAVIASLDRLLDRYGGVGAFGRDDQVSNAFLSNEIDQLRNLAAVMPPIFLAVAAFLLNIVVARLVQTEREQIGLLKAFGYGNGEVASHYLKLVGAITALGILIGWGAGAWMGHAITVLYQEFFRFPFLTYLADPASFATGALVALAAAGAGTIAAVRRAASLAPAVAMAPPPPTSYRGNPLERFGLTGVLTQSGRMIVRHILRWPLRAGLTVIGISFSAAILVVSLFFVDSVDEMMDAYFFASESQDMRLTFTEIRAEGAAMRLDDLPGVMAVETFRNAAARLRNGRLTERVTVRGVDPDAVLSRLVDDKGRAVAVPPAGIVLTEKLAELLHAKEGEFVTVEILEGRRPVQALPVAKIVQQYVGVGAYLDRRALNRLMREGNVISGADLLVDEAAEARLFRDLKEMPTMLGLSIRLAGYKTFRAIIHKNLYTMIFFYVLFASLIAVGVVYNSARIALSERARELGSLRVLGFTRGEVGAILAGELAALTLVALPLGCILGYGLAALMVAQFDTELYRVPLVVSRSTYGYASVAVIVAAAGSAWLVLRRVARLDLIAVLKTRE